MRGLYRLPIMAMGMVAVAACTNLPQLRETHTYAQLDCQELQQEQTALDARVEHAKDAQGFGFMDFLGAVTSGLAAGMGRADIVQQQDQIDQSRSHDREKLAVDGEAYQNRADLINKIRDLKQC
ncbi:hypothetical protein [Castellaniella sp.]|uniref:hypothetical protein n=1 Tax=Castellaniella sp. TaxID=1955812 RepID=UPI003C78142D